MKSLNRQSLIDRLKEIGITGKIELFYHVNDGWYLHCDQCAHEWIGQNLKHCIEQANEGLLNYLVES